MSNKMHKLFEKILEEVKGELEIQSQELSQKIIDTCTEKKGEEGLYHPFSIICSLSSIYMAFCKEFDIPFDLCIKALKITNEEYNNTEVNDYTIQ